MTPTMRISGRANGNGFGIDEFEYGFDEDLNLGRMGEESAHLDGDRVKASPMETMSIGA